ncbi:hypothetical protein [Hymenobacter metallilatus]|uniref:STAS/SEC14 domain-containing protein n=1 Tax=Hymenobacter metallilatus TaxID=2493666 RepID=A0A428JKA5_9BACT|nr:hypothetical protein [Hymenobacter metallilatus]RSK33187.1 hypothetical protein EI290_10760 [Hymenobacter metallilatus]
MSGATYENAMACILEHPDGYVLLRYLPRKRSLADVEEVLQQTGRLLQQRGWSKILSDQRLLSPLTEDEQALALDFWQARQFVAGPVTVAVVVAHNADTRHSLHQVQEQAHGALRYRLFGEEAAAAAWLRLS